MNWLNAFLLLVLAAGHAELVVTVINRLFALRLHYRVLHPIRHVHDVLILTFPLVLLWFVGLNGPRLLTDGQWSQLSPLWAAYLALCGVGVVGLTVSAVVYHLSRPPAAQESNHSQVVDIAARLGRRPVGPGRYRRLALLPGNQVFQVEFAEKTYRMPRLAPEWDGLSVLHVSDLHYHGTITREFYEEVVRLAAAEPADLVVFSGDLLDNQALTAWLPTTLGRLQAPLGCYFVLGNHDWYLEPEPIRRAVSELGWHDVAGKTAVIEGRGQPLVIGGSELPWMGRHPDFAAAPPDAFRLFISHTPDNLAWAQANRVDLMLSGHNHGGQVRLPLIGPVYSPSRYGCRYASGAFFRAPTLLYVSRGISGRHPLRFGARPEVTHLVLRSAENGQQLTCRTEPEAARPDHGDPAGRQGFKQSPALPARGPAASAPRASGA